MKERNQPIKMITCYDFWTAKILAKTDVDCILVGDSVAMVMHGHDNTLTANVAMMEEHIKAVKRGAPNKFIIGDMPFLSHRKSIKSTMEVVEKLMQAGSNAIKLEGVEGNEEIIKHIIDSGVPVMGHLGYMMQAVNMFGNKVVQGREQKQREKLIEEAKKIQQLGCFSLVLECIPTRLGEEITNVLSIATIGIGAGDKTNGQVLVLQDLLGGNPDFNPKFLKKYLNIHDLIKQAVNEYCREVEENKFPAEEHSYKEKTAEKKDVAH
jgi:3-methyl-2-oxobutanoate hydroxymethyltransferase